MFNKYLEPLFLHYLKDRASAVREIGTLRLKTLVEIFKTDWAIQTIIPKLNEVLKQETGYLFKIAALNSYQVFFTLIFFVILFYSLLLKNFMLFNIALKIKVNHGSSPS